MFFLNSFSARACFVLFELFFYEGSLVYYQNMSLLSRANLAPKTSAVNLLNSGVVTYSS